MARPEGTNPTHGLGDDVAPPAAPDGPQAPDAPAPRNDAAAPTGPQPPYVASCGNCTRMQAGNCTLGRVLAPGKLLCGDYEITPAFRDELVRVMMKDILTQVKETGQRVQQLRAAQRLWN